MLLQQAANAGVSASPLRGATICATKSRPDYTLESTADGFCEVADTSLHPVIRVDAANLMRALRQLEVIAKRQAPRIAIKAKGKILFLDVGEIVAVQAEGNYISLRHRTNPYLARESLSSMAEKLKPYGFVRIARSVVVKYIGGRRDPTFTDGRVQAACKRWEGILGNSYIQTSPQRSGSTVGRLFEPRRIVSGANSNC